VVRTDVVIPERVLRGAALRRHHGVRAVVFHRITGVLRTLPLLAPRLVTTTTGMPVSASVVPLVPPELS